MYAADTLSEIKSKFSFAQDGPPKERFIRNPEPMLMIPPEKWREVAQFLSDDTKMKFDLPIQLTAVDYIKETQFEIVLYLYSTTHKKAVILKSRIGRENAEIDSLTNIWPGLDYQEREVFDLMGISFKGHPNLKRIMMWEGFPGFPLRKDYVHVTDKYDSGLEIGTPGLDAKGVPIEQK